MKRLLYIWMVLLPTMLMAQETGVQIALRGGIGQWQAKDVQSSLSPAGGLDVSYLARWQAAQEVYLGFRLGLGASYTASKLTADMHDQYERQDLAFNTLQYTTSASVEEKHQQLNVEIPVMFSMRAYGFAMNIGPKLMMVANDKYEQTVTSAYIQAYYPKYNVTIRNEEVTGRLATPYAQSGSNTLPKLNLLLSAEVGYEWQVGGGFRRTNNQFIGVQLYVDYGVMSSLSQQDAFLDVAPIRSMRQTAQVTVGNMPASTKMQYLSAGVRFYYSILTIDQSGRGRHRRR